MKTKTIFTTLAAIGALFATSAYADVAARVQESGSMKHKGVLVFVQQAGSKVNAQEYRHFFSEGLGKVSQVAPDHLIQVVEPSEVPGGALAGSWVLLTADGTRVMGMQRGYKQFSDLGDFVKVVSAQAEQAAAAVLTASK